MVLSNVGLQSRDNLVTHCFEEHHRARGPLYPHFYKEVFDLLKKPPGTVSEDEYTALATKLDGLIAGKLKDKPAKQAAKGKRVVKWREVAKLLLEKRLKGEAFTSQHKLAEALGCSSETINKAIEKTDELHVWAFRQAKPKAQSLNAIVTGTKSQSTELSPEDEAAIREFIETADPQTKAWFLALPQDKQIDYLNDPDQHRRILGRKV